MRKPQCSSVANGEPTAAGDGRTSGYAINALYAPVGWLSWSDLVQRMVGGAEKSRETLQVFINTVLGETWKDEAAQVVDADVLYVANASHILPRCRWVPPCSLLASMFRMIG